ncbi:MAG: hypothetical protein DPW09_03100 [Anaerolineae bacterium]|nr:hypothetical protein [Anaerolineae bacterium]
MKRSPKAKSLPGKKPKYRFFAYVLERGEDNRPVSTTPVATYEFEAVSETGAMRTASEWFGKTWNLEGGAGPGEWQRSQSGRIACRDAYFRNLVICLSVVEPERDETLESFINEVRLDPAAAQARYGEQFLGTVARFVTYRMQQSAVTSLQGYVTFPYPNEQTLKDFDLLYDLSHVPSILAEKMGRTKPELDQILGSEKRVRVNCPFCNQDQSSYLLRRKNGYAYHCQYCGEIVKLDRDRVWRGQ